MAGVDMSRGSFADILPHEYLRTYQYVKSLTLINQLIQLAPWFRSMVLRREYYRNISIKTNEMIKDNVRPYFYVAPVESEATILANQDKLDPDDYPDDLVGGDHVIFTGDFRVTKRDERYWRDPWCRSPTRPRYNDSIESDRHAKARMKTFNTTYFNNHLMDVRFIHVSKENSLVFFNFVHVDVTLYPYSTANTTMFYGAGQPLDFDILFGLIPRETLSEFSHEKGFPYWMRPTTTPLLHNQTLLQELANCGRKQVFSPDHYIAMIVFNAIAVISSIFFGYGPTRKFTMKLMYKLFTTDVTMDLKHRRRTARVVLDEDDDNFDEEIGNDSGSCKNSRMNQDAGDRKKKKERRGKQATTDGRHPKKDNPPKSQLRSKPSLESKKPKKGGAPPDDASTSDYGFDEAPNKELPGPRL